MDFNKRFKPQNKLSLHGKPFLQINKKKKRAVVFVNIRFNYNFPKVFKTLEDMNNMDK